MKPLIAFLTFVAVASGAYAGELNQMVAEKSRITFTCKQMGVPVDGSFRKFDARIAIDPARPESATARVDVELASIDAGSDEATDAAKEHDWLNVAAFPAASFVASSVKSLGAGRYEARGQLNIKGLSRDTLVPFSIRKEGAGSWLEGGFILPRTQFKIGEGEWGSTDTVADAIQIRFKLFLLSKPQSPQPPQER